MKIDIKYKLNTICRLNEKYSDKPWNWIFLSYNK